MMWKSSSSSDVSRKRDRIRSVADRSPLARQNLMACKLLVASSLFAEEANTWP